MTRLLLALGFALALFAAGPARAGDSDDAAHQVLLMLQLPPAHFHADSGYSGGYGEGTGRVARHDLAERIAREHGLVLVDDWPMPVLGVDCFVLAVPQGLAPEQVAATLEHDPRVAWAQPMHVYTAQGHDDPLYATQPAAVEWHLADLHELATGRNVRVAVIDSGVDASHPDLAGQVADSQNFIDGATFAAERHGTAVAGIIAARADNGIGIAGIAPRAHVLALRACREVAVDSTLCTSLSLAKAMHFAIGSDSQIINLSLAGPDDRLLGELLDAAFARGITVVTAIDPARPDGGFPASHPGVVAVAESPPLPATAMLAPGRDVPTTLPGGRWGLVSGSSYASAHVAGLFALLRELGAPAKGQGAAAAMVRRPPGDIDACASLLRASGPRVCACANEPSAALALDGR